VNVWGALVGGVVGTLVLTSGLRAASELGLTRMDLPFLLGTALTENRVRAKAVGYGMHFGFGLLFALAYWVVFRVLDESGWLVGAALGLLHGVFAATALVNVLLPLVHPRMATPLTAAGRSPLLEPPGFLMLNYGRSTPAVTIAGHVAYGAIVGGFVSVAS
jgi:apolipoprotein N-acyltransferase